MYHDAQIALKYIQPDEILTYNIFSPVEEFAKKYVEMEGEPLSDFNKGNVKARMRMIAQYAICGMHGLLVIGTDHAAKAVTGFFTKFGDGGADILPLSGLTKRQGKALLKELKAPEKLYLKKPTADLLDGTPQQEDETELDITYEELDDYLEGKSVSKGIEEKIENRYLATEHKRRLPVSMFDTWWK
ncbi:ammonia-dependent NAD(+) synthetase [Bacillus salipaludis]|uniref:NH(3)-dependent NAD(+) synthetase n=1 Tax=Bacillus salipaludis TaxID=2547811 RepID=A0A4R5VK79_9BACI|nr:ammonia-dependent NAD(+) synthetase [Bacillus salipaludis]